MFHETPSSLAALSALLIDGDTIPARHMRVEHNAKISAQPLRKWRSYLSQRAILYALDPTGPEAKVRFLPKGFDAAID